MFRRAAVFPVCLASGEICLYPSTCRFPPFDAKLAEIAPTRAFSTGVRQKSSRMLRRHSRRDRMLKICHRHIFLAHRRGKNDSIFERLDVTFSFEQALQQSIAVKGANVTREVVRQMLKNWKRQGLIGVLLSFNKIFSTVLKRKPASFN